MRKRSEARRATTEEERDDVARATASPRNVDFEDGPPEYDGDTPAEVDPKRLAEQDQRRLERSASHATEARRKSYDFKSVNARDDRDAELRPDLAAIVETVFIEDMQEAWKQIRASLKVGAKRSEHGTLHKALDEARELSYDAHRLWATAKREYERWELENDVTFSALWNEAERALEEERKDKTRTKPITNEDVKAKINTLHPDEYAAQEKKRKAVKITVDNLAQLAKDASEHVEDLRVMLSKLRSAG